MFFETLKDVFSSEIQLVILHRLLICALIIAAATLVQKLGKRAIRRGFGRVRKTAGAETARKLDTTGAIITGLYKYIILIVAIMLILQTFQVDLSSVLTLAGIGGIAVGIGAQSLVRDIINGIFIWFENQFSVGDTITVADKCGVVVDFNLRTTKITDEDGELYIIPNSEIKIVKNSSRKNS